MQDYRYGLIAPKGMFETPLPPPSQISSYFDRPDPHIPPLYYRPSPRLNYTIPPKNFFVLVSTLLSTLIFSGCHGNSPWSFLQQEEESAGCKIAPAKIYATKVIQDLGSRLPNDEELRIADEANFSPETYYDYLATTEIFNDGVAKFVSNLFRLSSMEPRADEAPELLASLKQEPIVLVQKNRDKPWSYFFKTRDIFCTEETAALYDYPKSSVPGFVSCQLPKERAGFLSLISILRVTSMSGNPQAFYLANNNYHRVKSAVYLATGEQINSATNGPKGDANDLVPLADCVPTTDVRKKPDGLVYGTAAVPLEGRACSTCHSPHMAPLSVAFRTFGPNGEYLKDEDLTRLSRSNDVTFDLTLSGMKSLLHETRSCWAVRGGSAPSNFDGLSGLGEEIARNADFGRALGIQIPQHLANVEASPELVTTIKDAFDKGGKTLAAAMRGFFTSERYRCL